MPYRSSIDDLPTRSFPVVHVAAFALDASHRQAIVA